MLITLEQENILGKVTLWALIVVALTFAIVILNSCYNCDPAKAEEIINVEKLADSIYLAEGGAKTNHPYGILAHYKTTTPRQACINTIKSAIRRYEKTNQRLDFITFLGQTYCPVGASNDPTGLNKNWVHNVTYFYTRGAK